MKTKQKCVHVECVTNNLPHEEKGNLFCFPKPDSPRQQWIVNMNRPDLLDLTYTELLNRGYRVCQRHFTDNQFQTMAKKKLNTNQFPVSVLPPEIEQITQRCCEARELDGAEMSGPSTSTWTSPQRMENSNTGNDFPLCSTPRKRKGSTEHMTLRHLGVNKLQQLTPKKRNLYARMQKVEKMLLLSRKRGRLLSQKCKNRKVDLLSSSSLHNIENIYSLPRVLRIFVLSLMRNYYKTKKARRYTVEEKSIFLSIMKHGPRCYRFLQKLLCLPSTRTLKRCLSNFNLKHGINDKMFEYLKSVSENLSPQNRFCTLMFDEMEISKNLNLNVTKETWQMEGFVELETEERCRKFADHVLVFMIRGIAQKWKQPVAFYFTHSAANQFILKSLIKQVVRAVHERTSFKIVASVCDGGSWNVAALRSLSLESNRGANEFVYNIDGNKIIHLFDAPHLLKCMRNNFITKNVVFEGKTAKWTDIQKLYELDAVSGAFKCTKLTNQHINPTNRQKMKVKLAAQVFSQSTAAFLQVLTNAKTMEAAGTASFVKFMNELFDSLNCVYTSAKPLASRLTNNSSHFLFWAKAVKILNRLQFVGGRKRPPCLQLLISTISNAQYLWHSLKDNGFQYLILRSLNQDPLENLFSVARGLCGGNSKPSSSQFTDAYKTAILNNTVKCGVGTNCEDDGEKLLLSYQILLTDSDDTTLMECDTAAEDPSNPISSTSFDSQDSLAQFSGINTAALANIDVNKSAKMDVETGEYGPNRDHETGEWIRYDYDSETGEETSDPSDLSSTQRRTTFKIPSSCIKQTIKGFSPTENSRDMSPVLLFLLPTLFVYPGVTSILVAILEVVIHTWAHRVNKKLANKNVYYKSPMHIIASEFCAKCRDIKSMDKIEKLQDKRTLRFKCNYEYVKRIVT